jgi:hypothetical protein
MDMSGLEWTPDVFIYRQRWRESTGAGSRQAKGRRMTVAQLIDHLRAMPEDAIAVDGDELEVVSVMASQDLATVKIWTEQK